MGCYDMIVANCVCPYCGKIDKIMLDQTKDFDCTFRELSLGDLCYDPYYSGGFGHNCGEHECESCKNTYKYAVGFDNGVMTSIDVIDEIFDKKYSYFKPSDIKTKVMTEIEFKDKVQYLNKLKDILKYNEFKVGELEKANKKIEYKIKLLTTIINGSVSNVF